MFKTLFKERRRSIAVHGLASRGICRDTGIYRGALDRAGSLARGDGRADLPPVASGPHRRFHFDAARRRLGLARGASRALEAGRNPQSQPA